MTQPKNPKLWPNYVKCSTGEIVVGKSDIAQLKRPKLMPIVEKIDGQIHVIDSIPVPLTLGCSTDWNSSHEILKHDHRRWSAISTVEGMDYISFHLVLGHRIYAASCCTSMVFDSNTGNWEAPHPIARCFVYPFDATDVWDILENGIGRCVRGITYGVPKNPLYVVIALMNDREDNDRRDLFAVAYLLTSTGEIVCYQHLPHLFEGSVKPTGMLNGTVIDVGDNGEAMCFIMIGNDEECTGRYVFIYTITAEGLTEADSKVSEVWAKGKEVWPVEQEFVRVHVKGSSIYHSANEDGTEGMIDVRACFLPGSTREE